MKKTKFKLSTIDIIFLCITFYEVTVLPHMFFIAVKYAFLTYLFVKYAVEIKYIKVMSLLIFIYGGITLFASIYQNMPFTSITASLFYWIQITDIFLVARWYIKKYDTYKFVRIIFYTFLVYIAVNDALMMVLSYSFYDPNETYFIGNKFIVSYLHCFESCMFLYLMKYRAHKRKIKGFHYVLYKSLPLLFTLYSVLICLRVTCSTGAIICLLLFALAFVPHKVTYFLSDGRLIIIITLLINVLILGSFGLFTNSFVADIIANQLGKSITWQGRLIIYDVIFDIIKKSPYIGYGYYSNVVADAVNFSANAQNGILKIIIDSGYIGLAVYAAIVYLGLRRNKKYYNQKFWIFYAFIYVMVIASLVEINLNHMIVFMSIAIIYVNNLGVDVPEGAKLVKEIKKKKKILITK